MNKYFISILVLFFLTINQTMSEENIMILKLKDGDVKIELFDDVAPKHVKRIKELAESGKYDNVVFHRVIDGFMAQTGDVKFGNSESKDFDLNRVGTGGSDLPDLQQEFSNSFDMIWSYIRKHFNFYISIFKFQYHNILLCIYIIS